MVHRPADSRLLTNLLNHEKEYSKHLLGLLDYSHASLASFSAYASASAPRASQAILAVAGSLAGADDALLKYSIAVEQWRDHLKSLKSLEDDVGNIMRDREILVTRLIKVSKSQKPTRESLLVHHPSTSTSSLKTDFSSAFNSTSKLSAAQAELQACEAHLAEKERELDGMRADAVREGLRVRCTAMVECGWTWGEMGKEGLRAVENMVESQAQSTTTIASRSQSPDPTEMQRQYQAVKPLPDPNRPSSDLSSLAPSQSASQTPSESYNHIHNQPNSNYVQNRPNTYQKHQSILKIPPAHAISEFTLPTLTTGSPSSMKHVLARRITEEDLHSASHEDLTVNDGHGSSEDEDIGPVQVVENVRFAGAGGSSAAVGGGSIGAAVGRRFSIRSPGTKSDLGPATPVKRERRVSSSGRFFGSIRGLFKKDKDKDEDEDRGRFAGFGGEKKWATRTERNLKKRDDDSSDEGHPASPIPLSPVSPESPKPDPIGGRRLKKGRTVGTKKSRTRKDEAVELAEESDRASRAKEWVGGQERERRATTTENTRGEKGENEERGWMSDDGVPVVGSGSGGQGAAKSKTKRAGTASKVLAQTSNLSRNSSITSAVSAPASPGRKTRRASLGVYPKPSSNIVTLPNGAPGRKRGQSVDGSSPRKPYPKAGTYHMPDGGGPMGEGSVSLMSIVEGVAKQNREGWKLENWDQVHGVRNVTPPPGPGPKMEVVKAPPSVTRGDLDTSFPLVSAAAYAQAKSGGFEIPRAPGSIFAVQPTAPVIPMSSSAPAALTASGGVNGVGDGAGRVARPTKSPLRSALRSSRTPSPLPPPMRAPAPITKPAASSTSNAGGAREENTDSDDTASMSSYETGHEGFEDEVDQERHPLPALPPPTRNRDANHSAPKMNGGPPQMRIQTKINGTLDLSASSSSTEAPPPPSPPRRRKSVRVSLEPTFSATPPALEDSEYGDGHAPWGNRSTGGGNWQTRRGVTGEGDEVKDLWEDSSEEDEQYKRAKRLLTRTSKKEKKSR